jgi:large subunit ribosomal protein L2
MGKNLISQRRGKGTSTFRSHGFRYVGVVKHHAYSEEEKTGKITGTVTDIVHSAGHYAPVAQVDYGKEKALEIAPFGIKVGDTLNAGTNAEVKDGNIMPLSSIPEGTFIFNIESMPGDGGKFVRSSGSFARLLTKSDKKVTVMLPSKKEHTFSPLCRATIGIISGGGRTEKPMLKAGLMAMKRGAKGRAYPSTSALSMNSVAHPFGGSSSSAKNGPMIARKNAPAGAKVGSIRPRRTGRKRK